jgi:hypothetical protein
LQPGPLCCASVADGSFHALGANATVSHIAWLSSCASREGAHLLALGLRGPPEASEDNAFRPSSGPNCIPIFQLSPDGFQCASFLPYPWPPSTANRRFATHAQVSTSHGHHP